MNTIRLFDQDVDIREFDAEVCSCRASGDHWEVVLDQTAFFPEGGGQGADQGMLGNVRVLDTREPHEQKGTVVHFTDGPLEEGSQVHGVIDGTRRLDMMQQHTATAAPYGSEKGESADSMAGYAARSTEASVFTWIPGTSPLNVPRRAPASDIDAQSTMSPGSTCRLRRLR